MTRKMIALAVVCLGVLMTACSVVRIGADVVPTTGDTANDPTAAQRFLPNIPGYTMTEATSLTSSINSVAGGASLLTGNPALAAAVAQIDGMIQCYQSVGAVAGRIYTQGDISTLTQGQIPKAGALAVINQDRLVSNFLPCALGSGGNSLSAQSAEFQPCTGSGSTVVGGETISYIYAATTTELCAIFEAQFPLSER